MLPGGRLQTAAAGGMLYRVTITAVLGIVLAALVGSSSAGAPATPAPHALVRTGVQMQLTRVDLARLAPSGPRVALGRAAASWAYSPDRRQLAISTVGGIRFVDLRSMRAGAVLPQPKRLVQGLAWPAPRRLFVIEHGAVIRVDPARPRLISQAAYRGNVLAWAQSRGGIVLLTREEQGIGPPTLVAVGPAGRARSATLARIDAGSFGGPNNEGPFRVQSPALAVDRAAGRVYVVADGPNVATVDLASLAVAYHVPVAERRIPAARAKAASGSVREAAWLGGGMLAVTGAELSTAGNAESFTSTPVGLRVIDTRTWRSRTIDPDASSLAVESGNMLAFGGPWNGRRKGEGMGVAAYSADGLLRYRLFEGSAVGGVSTGGGRAYFWAGGLLRAVDAASGTLVASARPREPFVVIP
jgi:hypothetical protein